MRTVQENRRRVRFATSGCTLVSFGNDNKLGEVLNVSLGGLAFRCIAGEEPSISSGKLNVYCNNGLCLEAIPFKMIWNLEITDAPPFHYITTVRSGVQFTDLAQKQKSSLSDFIQSQTSADPEA